MITYKCNDAFEGLSYRVYLTGSERKIIPVENGDPFRGEALKFSWESLRDAELAVTVTLPQSTFLDGVVLRTSEKTALQYVRLIANGTLLDEHRAETGKSVSKHTIELTAGVTAAEVTLLFCCDFSELSILSVDLYGSAREKADIFPLPQSVCFGDEYISVGELTTYTAAGDAEDAGKIFAEKLSETAKVTAVNAPSGRVRFLTDREIPRDGYRLEVTENSVTVAASGKRGFVMGAETLIKLVDDGRIPVVTVADVPAKPFRGVHLMVPSKEQMQFAKRLIKNVISPLGYNTVILELAGLGMRFDSHPEIAERVEEAIEMSRRGEMPPFPHGESVGGGKAVEKETLKEFIDYIRSFGIEVIPEVQSLGHVQFMTYTYPEIAERDAADTEDVDIRLADALPAQVYPHCYCPSNPRSYEILFDLLDEVIELFAPLTYVHIGHDEVYKIGVCPKCREKNPAELFAYDVKRIYDYLAERGIKTMMWSDMLQPVTKYKTYPAAEELPRDIVMLDFIWYFHLDKDIEENLLPHGFPVAFGNLYSSHFPRYESRIAKEGIIGGQISTWVSTEEDKIQAEGKFYDIYMVAQMLWDGHYSHLHRPTYDRMISGLMPRTRERIKGISYPSLSKETRRQSLLKIGEFEFACHDEVSACQSLVFTHTLRSRYTRLPWKKQESVGEYRITYRDGTQESVNIRSGGEVGYCGARPGEPLKSPLYRHGGYTASYECDSELTIQNDGSWRTSYRFEYLLKSNKPIASVTWEQEPSAELLDVLGVEGIFECIER